MAGARAVKLAYHKLTAWLTSEASSAYEWVGLPNKPAYNHHG